MYVAWSYGSSLTQHIPNLPAKLTFASGLPQTLRTRPHPWPRQALMSKPESRREIMFHITPVVVRQVDAKITRINASNEAHGEEQAL